MPATQDINDRLTAYGVPCGRLRNLSGAPRVDTLDFLDLHRLPEMPASADEAIRPDAVVTSDAGNVLYVVNESRLFKNQSAQNTQLRTLRKKLASRGDHSFLACVRPGELLVTPVSLSKKGETWQTFSAQSDGALGFFAAFANGLLDASLKRAEADYVFSAMFKLVWSSASRLADLGIPRSDVLSLVGRALFFRFLYDREIVGEEDRAQILPEATSILEAFDGPINAIATCQWLDKTFNGDLLPLSDPSDDYFESLDQRIGRAAFAHLDAIVQGCEPVGDVDYQLPLPMTFAAFDFAHVPVGLLSQVYERLAWQWERTNSKDTSVHYTPRHLANLMVGEAFDDLPNAHAARVLDPACGASVFLVLAFRRIYQERWKQSGGRPETEEIREILDKQLVGFDISETAIRLASLSLYLTAIELDPDPVPAEKLHFNELRDKVLFNFRREGVDPEQGAVAGSLGDAVPKAFDGTFDLVLGNPPWTSLAKKDSALARSFEKLSKQIIENRGNAQLASRYQNPDRSPDLPFIWKSTEWCKPNGRIALALPARILLKQEKLPRNARESLLRLVEVTGIINGSNLSDTKVWEKMNQPFMLLFAVNRVPAQDHRLRFITPHYDETLNNKGLLRIDSKSTQWVNVSTTFDRPWMWKALAVGTTLDVGVTDKLLEKELPSVLKYWKHYLGLATGRGYETLDNHPQQDASFLSGKPDLTSIERGVFQVDPARLKPFERKYLCWPRDPNIYKSPLFLLKQAPGATREEGRGLLSFDDLAYSRSFHGYSAHGSEIGNDLVGYLHLLAHSDLMVYFALCTKPRFGAERRVLDKADFDDCPIVPYEDLTPKQKSAASKLSGRLLRADLSVFPEIDRFFSDLYELDEYDQAVIRDTVETAMPFQKSRRRACQPPDKSDRRVFLEELKRALQPFFEINNETLDTDSLEHSRGDSSLPSSFEFILLRTNKTVPSLSPQWQREMVFKLADNSGASRIIEYLDKGLLIGLLNQYRYWTPSRARLLAAEIAREHLHVFDA